MAVKSETKKKKRGKTALIVLGSIIGVIVLALLICMAVSLIGIKSNTNFIKTMEPVSYENQLKPEIADDGYYTFVTDDNFKVMQLTDIHIGAGFLSIKKDSMALNAVSSMISEEKPDLVVVSGDIAYPIPFQAGTFNNKNSARLFANLMEQLGVYWAPAFGNHDTESYSYFTREDICDFYTSGEFPHCLLQAGPEEVDGAGNYVVNISQSYLGDRIIDGIVMKYDRIHDNQVEWYKNQINALTEENGGETPKSLAFFHIPLIEYKDAWQEYVDNDSQDTENVKYYYGKVGEKDSGIFDAAAELGSTQGFFCGHDHLNNFSLDYKGIRLTYGYSIDYLAYIGIMKHGIQRGCTMINIAPDGSFDTKLENYYQDKYSSVKDKERVDMESWIPIY